MQDTQTMDDDKDKDFFEGFFPFFGGFDRQFKDMMHQMDEMSRQFDEMFRNTDIHVGFTTPGISEHLPPLEGHSSPLKNDPRTQMLKEDSVPETTPTNNLQMSPVDSRSRSRFWTWNTSDLFSDLSNPNTTVFGRMKSVQTIRRVDGSEERIEKTTENGRTCTTVTKTDLNGVTTSTTTCDRPSIEGAPRDSMVPSLPTQPDCGCSGTQDQNKSSLPPQKPAQDWFGTQEPSIPRTNTQLSKEDEGFFSKLFGNLGFGKTKS